MSTVTAERPAGYESGSIRNSGENRTSEAVTDRRTEGYAAIPRAVTCAQCNSDIPVGERRVIVRIHWSRKIRSGDPVCLSCAGAELSLFPWNGSGVDKSRPQTDYHHRCPRCRCLFYGAVQRRYCSDQCGELTRNGRRDRTSDREPRPCEVCADVFTPPRSDGRYCSPACRQKAYRTRQAGAS